MKLLIIIHSPLYFGSFCNSQRGHNPQSEIGTIFLALKSMSSYTDASIYTQEAFP